jgi:hypothetical protein
LELAPDLPAAENYKNAVEKSQDSRQPAQANRQHKVKQENSVGSTSTPTSKASDPMWTPATTPATTPGHKLDPNCPEVAFV